jgi:hypothetical protein
LDGGVPSTPPSEATEVTAAWRESDSYNKIFISKNKKEDYNKYYMKIKHTI